MWLLAFRTKAFFFSYQCVIKQLYLHCFRLILVCVTTAPFSFLQYDLLRQEYYSNPWLYIKIHAQFAHRNIVRPWCRCQWKFVGLTLSFLKELLSQTQPSPSSHRNHRGEYSFHIAYHCESTWEYFSVLNCRNHIRMQPLLRCFPTSLEMPFLLHRSVPFPPPEPVRALQHRYSPGAHRDLYPNMWPAGLTVYSIFDSGFHNTRWINPFNCSPSGCDVIGSLIFVCVCAATDSNPDWWVSFPWLYDLKLHPLVACHMKTMGIVVLLVAKPVHTYSKEINGCSGSIGVCVHKALQVFTWLCVLPVSCLCSKKRNCPLAISTYKRKLSQVIAVCSATRFFFFFKHTILYVHWVPSCTDLFCDISAHRRGESEESSLLSVDNPTAQHKQTTPV